VCIKNKALHVLYFTFIIIVLSINFVGLLVNLRQFWINYLKLGFNVRNASFWFLEDGGIVFKGLQSLWWHFVFERGSLIFNIERVFLWSWNFSFWGSITLINWDLLLVVNIENQEWIILVFNTLVDHKVLVVILSEVFQLFVSFLFVFFENFTSWLMLEILWVIWDHFILALIINHKWNFLATKNGKLHSLLNKTTFSLAVSNIAQVEIVDVLDVSIFFLSGLSFGHLVW